MKRLDARIRRSKKVGKIAMALVVALSVGFGVILIQGLALAAELGRTDNLIRGALGLVLLISLDAFALILVRRQHRTLDEARLDLEALVRDEPPE